MEAWYVQGCEAYLRYVDFPGGGAACVFLHGLLGASTGWYAHVAARPPLAGRHTLLLDCLGHGYSDQPPDFGYTVEDHASTLIGLLDHLGLRGCHLIGHHLGGCIAITASVMRPDLVSALVLFHVPLDGGWGMGRRIRTQITAQTEEEWLASGHRAFLAQLQAPSSGEDPAILARVMGTAQLISPRALYRAAASLARTPSPSWRQLLSQLTIPRTYLMGPEEANTDRGAAVAAGGTEIRVVPNVTDRPNFENPDGLASAIAESLGKP
jgi:pimeloyl-ACP methyl ester carboxylesterase